MNGSPPWTFRLLYWWLLISSVSLLALIYLDYVCGFCFCFLCIICLLSLFSFSFYQFVLFSFVELSLTNFFFLLSSNLSFSFPRKLSVLSSSEFLQIFATFTPNFSSCQSPHTDHPRFWLFIEKTEQQRQEGEGRSWLSLAVTRYLAFEHRHYAIWKQVIHAAAFSMGPFLKIVTTPCLKSTYNSSL